MAIEASHLDTPRWRSWLAHARDVRGRLGSVPAGLRTRILAWFIGLLVFATICSILVTQSILSIRLNQRIDADLVQESAELRALAAGKDPATGQAFANVKRVFSVYLERNVPSRNEALITFVDGKPYKRSSQVVPYRLDTDPELAARWGRLRDTDRGRVETPAGRVEYLAVPVRPVRAEVGGVFVAAIFHERESDETNAVVRAAGAVGLAVLLLGSLLAWRLAGRVVGPVTALTRTARSISETDFSRRIPHGGRDEVAQLAATFNAMVERLERAFASQRRFVNDAGHELRTPLTIVRGHLELIEDDPDERRETIALVLDELDRMGRIVEDLLLLSSHEQPDFLRLATVDVGALTDELESKVLGLGQREWVVESRGRGVIVADRHRLTQAVLQLAENAVRYGDRSHSIVLGSRVLDGEASFWVRDGGPGIPLQEQKRIFERFHRKPMVLQSRSGAGLGLAIVKAIADAHRGRVELDSRPGKGSTFTIVVPIDPPEEEEAVSG